VIVEATNHPDPIWLTTQTLFNNFLYEQTREIVLSMFLNEALEIHVVKAPMPQKKNTVCFFPPDLVQEQPIRSYVVITSGWVTTY